MLDYLCPACVDHFDRVKAGLKDLDISFVVDSRLVRGLDYYTRTVFEMKTARLGAQDAVAGGGRYDVLVEMLGGPSQPATGFAIGFDRLVELMDPDRGDYTSTPDVFIATLGESSRENALKWSCDLGREGVRTEMDLSGRSLKSMMKRANRLGAAYVLIAGDKELEKGEAVLRNMSTKEQVQIPMTDLVASVKASIRS